MGAGDGGEESCVAGGSEVKTKAQRWCSRTPVVVDGKRAQYLFSLADFGAFHTYDLAVVEGEECEREMVERGGFWMCPHCDLMEA